MCLCLVRLEQDTRLLLPISAVIVVQAEGGTCGFFTSLCSDEFMTFQGDTSGFEPKHSALKYSPGSKLRNYVIYNPFISYYY